ncbi:MAG: hypothetical protein U9O18_08190 [Chloroflexota bacterium]|nr:hypothetical protein [Chloroflexota bacterium]
MTDPDAETDAIVAELEKAGLVEQYTNAEGKAAMRLTPNGTQVGARWRWPAMRMHLWPWTRC